MRTPPAFARSCPSLVRPRAPPRQLGVSSSANLDPADSVATGKDGGFTEPFFNPNGLVPFCHPLRPGEGANFELVGSPTNGQVNDRCVLGFSRSRRYDCAPPDVARGFQRIVGLSQRSRLIRLEEHRIAGIADRCQRGLGSSPLGHLRLHREANTFDEMRERCPARRRTTCQHWSRRGRRLVRRLCTDHFKGLRIPVAQVP
jgi:hypothetical protein